VWGMSNMKKTIAIIIISLAITIKTNGQPNDWLEYYPMHIGDKWEYTTKDFRDWWTPPEVSVSKIEISGDTLMPNGHRYFIIAKYYLKQFISYQRIDTLNKEVKYYCPCNNLPDDEAVAYNLDYNPDTTMIWINSFGHAFKITHHDSSEYSSYPHIVYFSDSLVASAEVLVKNLGLFYSWASEGGFGYDSLTAAIIDGRRWGVSSLANKHAIQPSQYCLYQNFPNPFNSETTIQFFLPIKSKVTIELFNLRGQEIDFIVNSVYPQGLHQISLDSRNLNSGIYYYRFFTGTFVSVKKLIVLK
jgi:hypothetical protein